MVHAGVAIAKITDDDQHESQQVMEDAHGSQGDH
jgi:hydrogenase maturation factor